MKKLLLLTVILSCFFAASAQYSPSAFKHLQRPEKRLMLSLAPTQTVTLDAFRFSAVTGYEFGTSQLVAGLAYGFQHLTADTAGNWYENYGVGVVVFGGGSTLNGFNPAGVFSVGVNINALNGLVSISPVYNFSGKFGLVWSLNLPLK